VTDHGSDGLAALGLSGAAPVSDPRRGRHLVVLSMGLAVTLGLAAVLLLVALPPIAHLLADIFLFITRWLTGK